MRLPAKWALAACAASLSCNRDPLPGETGDLATQVVDLLTVAPPDALAIVDGPAPDLTPTIDLYTPDLAPFPDLMPGACPGSLLTVAKPLSFPNNWYSIGPTRAADFDRDGKLDLIAFSELETRPPDFGALVFPGRGDGTFDAPAILARDKQSWGALDVGDLNEDGSPDFVILGKLGTAASVLINKGKGTFDPQVNYLMPDPSTFPEGLLFGDYNEDGHLDLIASDSSFSADLFVGRGDGTLAKPATVAPGIGFTLAGGDFNGDGHLDLAGASASDPTGGVIVLGDGKGHFQKKADFHTDFRWIYAVTADLDSDGRLDIVMSSDRGNALVVAYGRGDGTVEVTYLDVTSLSLAAAVADFDGDGKLDVAATLFGEGELVVLINQGKREFSPPYVFPVGEFSGPAQLAVADWNRDGQLDVAMGMTSHQDVQILLNTCH